MFDAKGAAMKGRIEFFFIAALACQSLPVTSLMAADQTGVASVYSTESGSRTASGEKLNPEALIAAHRTLPFGTKAKVRNKQNGQSVDVIIKDRGPFRLFYRLHPLRNDVGSLSERVGCWLEFRSPSFVPS